MNEEVTDPGGLIYLQVERLLEVYTLEAILENNDLLDIDAIYHLALAGHIDLDAGASV